jgi:dienelactone hydrolase
MREEKVSYEINGVQFSGRLVFDESIKGKRPAILVAHAWRGQDDFAIKKAHELAKLGYVGFASDLYGNGIHVQSNEEAAALMLPLFIDRKALRDRVVAAYRSLSQAEVADPHRIGAIGFCFGGMAVLELLRSGVSLKGVVSFHGILGNTLGEHKARLAPSTEKMHGSILILHGHEDPLVSVQDILTLQNELTKANVDWQMNIYSHTKHAFTNPEAHEEQQGLVFNEKANRRSWQTMCNFFNEVMQ